MRFHFSNLFMEFSDLSLVIRDFLIEGFPLTKTLFLLVFELVEFPLTSLTRIPFDLRLIEFRVYLKIIILSEAQVLGELSKESLKLDKVLHHLGWKVAEGQRVEKFENITSNLPIFSKSA